jgi:hypothetical protein
MREGFACELPQCSAGLIYNFPGFDPGLSLVYVFYELCVKILEVSPLTRGHHLISVLSGLWLSRDALLSFENRGFRALAPASLFPDALYDPRGCGALLQGMFLVLPHVGRGMSTITMWSEQCASSGSMGNLSGTRYPPQSSWSLAMPHVRHPVNRQLSIPSLPNHLRSGQRARCLPLEEGQPRRLRSG